MRVTGITLICPFCDKECTDVESGARFDMRTFNERRRYHADCPYCGKPFRAIMCNRTEVERAKKEMKAKPDKRCKFCSNQDCEWCGEDCVNWEG